MQTFNTPAEMQDYLQNAYAAIVPPSVACKVNHINTVKGVVAGQLVVVELVAGTHLFKSDVLIDKMEPKFGEAGYLVVPVANLNRSSKDIVAYYEVGCSELV